MIDLYLNDVAASAKGVVLKKPPDTVSAAARGERIEVAGVDGETWPTRTWTWTSMCGKPRTWSR